MSEVQEIAGRLSEAQRRLILAGSKHPKRWMTIIRHAKLKGRVEPVRGAYRFFDHGEQWRKGYFLNDLGLQVRAHLQATQDERK